MNPLHSDTAVEQALNDRERLEEIADLELFSSDVESLLHEDVVAAAAHFGLPVALVSIVLDGAQHFAASHGLSDWLAEAKGTPVEWAFCRFAVAAKEPFVVADAPGHELVGDNPLVALEGIRCYAGIPLVSSKGNALGTLCVIGGEAREFSGDELAELRARASRVVEKIEARARAKKKAA